MEKTPSLSLRIECGPDILDKACQGDAEMENFDCFSVQILHEDFWEMISSIVGRCRVQTESTCGGNITNLG
jgi:hypothetical protein